MGPRGRLALAAGVLAVGAGGLVACVSLVANVMDPIDPTLRAHVEDGFAMVPPDVEEALGLGPLRTYTWGSGGYSLGGERSVDVPFAVRRDAGDPLAASESEVAECVAVVSALEPTSGRWYAPSPVSGATPLSRVGGDDWWDDSGHGRWFYEVTEATCRGFEVPGRYQLAVPGPGGDLIDTGLAYDSYSGAPPRLQSWADEPGLPYPVVAGVRLVDLPSDAGGGAAPSLPPPDGSEVLVVLEAPVGREVEIRPTCDEGTTEEYMTVDGPALAFLGRGDDVLAAEGRALPLPDWVACGKDLAHPVPPFDPWARLPHADVAAPSSTRHVLAVTYWPGVDRADTDVAVSLSASTG